MVFIFIYYLPPIHPSLSSDFRCRVSSRHSNHGANYMSYSAPPKRTRTRTLAHLLSESMQTTSPTRDKVTRHLQILLVVRTHPLPSLLISVPFLPQKKKKISFKVQYFIHMHAGRQTRTLLCYAVL